MNRVRNIAILAGFTLALVALGATGARAQSLSRSIFGGSFTLPFEAQWGAMTLPAGDYTLHYGTIGSARFVEVNGVAKGSPHGLLLAQMNNPTTARKNAIVCVRDGNALIVRALELPAVGEAINFRMPRGAQLMAHLRNGNAPKLLAEGPVLVERVRINMNKK